MGFITSILQEAVYKEDVESSNLHSVRYDDKLERLQIRFLNGAIYEYYDVPMTVFEQLLDADSKGSFAYYNICYEYRYRKIRSGKKYKSKRKKKSLKKKKK